jgi:HlyD family secretion protein
VLREAPLTYQSQVVTPGNLAITVNTTGTLLANVYNITFTGSGKLTEIDVREGQHVEKNQVLAKLDASSLQNALDEAKANVSAAQTRLNNAKVNYSATTAATHAAIVAAQTILTNAQANVKKVQAESRANIAAAKTMLSNAQTNLKMVQAKTRAQLTVANDQEQQAIHVCHTGPNAPPNCVQLAKHQFTLAQAQAAAQVAAAQNQVTLAQSTLNKTQAQADAQNTAAQAQVVAAQNALNVAQKQAYLQNTSAQTQIDTAQSQLDQAQLQLRIAQSSLNNTVFKALHAGTVTIMIGVVGGIPGVVGDIMAGKDNIFIQIEDLSSLSIQASVDESQIGGVVPGERVQFSVSAYGDRLFKGKVRAISPLGSSPAQSIIYPVFIDIDMKDVGNANLLPGMTGQVTIFIIGRYNVLLVPVRAVNYAHSALNLDSIINKRNLLRQDQVHAALLKAQQMLQVLQQSDINVSKEKPIPAVVLEYNNKTIIVKPVVLGLTNGTNYEVLAGLATGNSVLVDIHPTS